MFENIPLIDSNVDKFNSYIEINTRNNSDQFTLKKEEEEEDEEHDTTHHTHMSMMIAYPRKQIVDRA